MAKTKKNNQQQDFRRSLRFQSLKKKLNELTLLCDVDAFLLCSDQHGTGNGVLHSSYSWPEDQRSFLSLINKYNNYSKDENKKKKKKRKRNEGISIDFGFDMTGFQSSMEDLGSDEVQGMLHRIEWKKRKVIAMLHSLKQKNQIVNEEKSSHHASRISDEECCENHDSLLMMNEGSDMWSSLLQSEFVRTEDYGLVKEEPMNQGKEGSDMWSGLVQSEFVQTGAYELVKEEEAMNQGKKGSEDYGLVKEEEAMNQGKEGSDISSDLQQSKFVRTEDYRLVKEEPVNQGKEGSDMWSGLVQSKFVQTGAYELVKEEEAMNQGKEGSDMWSDLLQSEFVLTEDYGLFEEEAMKQGKEGSDMWNGFLESVELKNGAYGLVNEEAMNQGKESAPQVFGNFLGCGVLV